MQERILPKVIPPTLLSLLILLASPLHLNALSSDDASYVYFSGFEADVDDPLASTNAFTEIVEDVDKITEDDGFIIDETLSDTSWFAGWEYSTITGLDSSYIRYDEDNGEYEIVYFLKTSSDDSYVFASQLQQLTSWTTILELVESGGKQAQLETENFTFLKTLSDSVICRIYFKGSHYDSISDFSVDFFYPSGANVIAYTYTISDGTTDPLFVDDEDLFTEYEEDIIEGVDELEDSNTNDSISTALSAIDDDAESAGTEALVELILQDKDTYLGELEAAVDALNDIQINIGDNDQEDDVTVYDFTLEELTDYSMPTGYIGIRPTDDIGIPVMSFDFDGLDVSSVDNIDLLVDMWDAAQDNDPQAETVNFTPTFYVDDDMDSLIDLLSLSIDEDDEGADTQGAYTIAIVFEDTYNITISGKITDPSIVGAAGNYLLASNNSEVIDEDAGWYKTWVKVVNFESPDSDWGYSPVFGSFYAGVANDDFDSPWLWADAQVLQQWIHTAESDATDGGFWAYASGTGSSSGLEGWIFIAVEASQADPQYWFIYEFNTDTFHTFNDL
ncbi:hypothetical protein [Rubellicoccus peritrichatus]|uniref:Uncharacterized protein n=1 Tax=Rubellicoccus peritrichatus TaxID=3080537 RepID=A0AAQ3LB19_9BACT|nr:hypothetical protein [Puniceicoccus sp. CR14]WOO41244.1 hypothetical protein RZN69_21700 [Puniceicoccus sp. CR14]